MISPTTAEIAITACSDIYRGAGEILASPTGPIPTIGARLAKLTHAPDLLLTDGEGTIIADVPAIDEPSARAEGQLTYADLFELIYTGRRHVIMGAPQLDRFGNQNLSAIGDHEHPIRQLLGTRAAATNTVNHPTSYWVPRHSRRVFVEKVDYVTGIGNDRAPVGRFHHLHSVVTNLGVLDFSGPKGSMAVVSTHPGIGMRKMADATSFPLHFSGEPPTTRLPDAEELRLIREVLDPHALRHREVPPQ